MTTSTGLSKMTALFPGCITWSCSTVARRKYQSVAESTLREIPKVAFGCILGRWWSRCRKREDRSVNRSSTSTPAGRYSSFSHLFQMLLVSSSGRWQEAHSRFAPKHCAEKFLLTGSSAVCGKQPGELTHVPPSASDDTLGPLSWSGRYVVAAIPGSREC